MSMRASLLYSLILRYSLVSADCKLNFRFIPGQTNKSSDNGESSKHKLFRLVVQSVSIYAIGWRQSLQPTRQSWTRFLSRYCGNFSFSARVRCFEVTHIVVSIQCPERTLVVFLAQLSTVFSRVNILDLTERRFLVSHSFLRYISTGAWNVPS